MVCCQKIKNWICRQLKFTKEKGILKTREI
jgi:hypothetical protein